VEFLADKGVLGLLAGVLLGVAITVLIHSSSAATAVILTLTHKGLLTWEFAAAMVLGSNIGTTIDAVIVAIGAKLNARRAAAVHVLFNVTGTVLAMIFFRPFLTMVEALFPGGLTPENVTAHLAMLHTVFNVSNTVIFLPFVRQFAQFVERLIQPGEHEPPETYQLVFPTSGIKENAESYVFRAEREILGMSDLVRNMFNSLIELLQTESGDTYAKIVNKLAGQEQYADQMQEEISAYLVHTSELPLSERTRENVRHMLQIVDDLESMTDEIFMTAMLLQRSRKKNLEFSTEDVTRLKPYIELAEKFLQFVHKNLNKPLSKEQLAQAGEMEDEIDRFRKNLKKFARKRLEKGANVKSELLYIDVVRTIEKIGDHAFSISEMLAQTR
jgi:phosphate:Na+ symporter